MTLARYSGAKARPGFADVRGPEAPRFQSSGSPAIRARAVGASSVEAPAFRPVNNRLEAVGL